MTLLAVYSRYQNYFGKRFWSKKKLRAPAFTGCNPVQEKSGMHEVTFSYRVDVFLGYWCQ